MKAPGPSPMIRRLLRQPAGAGRPALFVDRDGVLNRRVVGGYVLSPDGLVVLDLAVAAVRDANASGRPVIMVTNQGAISQGLLDVATLDAIHHTLLAGLAERDAHVDAIYACPHHPNAVADADRHCDCRKPAPGLLLAAAADLGVDLGSSMMIGDQPSDRAAAIAAGIPAAACLDVGEGPVIAGAAAAGGGTPGG